MFKMNAASTLKFEPSPDIESQNDKMDAEGMFDILAALDKSQATIEFNLDGTIITANENFLGAMGYSLNEVHGKHHSIFVEDQEKASAEYQEFWAELNLGKFQAREFKRINKSGNEIWIEASYNPVVDKNDNVYKIIKYATDITTKKWNMPTCWARPKRLVSRRRSSLLKWTGRLLRQMKTS